MINYSQFAHFLGVIFIITKSSLSFRTKIEKRMPRMGTKHRTNKRKLWILMKGKIRIAIINVVE